VLRVEAGLFFANADHVREAIRHAAAKEGTRAIVLDAETVAFIDVTAADMLATLTGELAATGVELVVAHDVGQVRDTLRERAPRIRSGIGRTGRSTRRSRHSRTNALQALPPDMVVTGRIGP
jgi:anti-anti-sigma factor